MKRLSLITVLMLGLSLISSSVTATESEFESDDNPETPLDLSYEIEETCDGEGTYELTVAFANQGESEETVLVNILDVPTEATILAGETVTNTFPGIPEGTSVELVFNNIHEYVGGNLACSQDKQPSASLEHGCIILEGMHDGVYVNYTLENPTDESYTFLLVEAQKNKGGQQEVTVPSGETVNGQLTYDADAGRRVVDISGMDGRGFASVVFDTGDCTQIKPVEPTPPDDDKSKETELVSDDKSEGSTEVPDDTSDDEKEVQNPERVRTDYLVTEDTTKNWPALLVLGLFMVSGVTLGLRKLFSGS